MTHPTTFLERFMISHLSSRTLATAILLGIMTATAWGQSPIAHWPLDGTGDEAVDVVGSLPGQIDGAQRIPALLDGGLEFDGTDDRVSLTGPLVGGDQITLALWFRAAGFGVGDARLISRASGTGAGDHDWMLSTIEDGGAFRLRARLRVGGNTTTLIGSGGSIETGVWTHAALVYDGATLTLYQDGLAVGSAALSGDLDERTGLTVALGNQPGGAGERPFHGALDDVRVYAAALDTTDLAEVMDPCDGLPVATFDLITDGVTVPVTLDVDGSTSSDCDGSILSYTWDFGDGQTGTGATAQHVYTAPGTYTVALTTTDDTGQTATATGSVTVLGTDQRMSENLLAAWDFTDGGGTVIADVSGISPTLALTVADPDQVQWDPCGGLAVIGPTLIASAGPADKLNNALRTSNAVTLEAWLVPASLDQIGPARAVTLSGDAANRRARLIFRSSWLPHTRIGSTGIGHSTREPVISC